MSLQIQSLSVSQQCRHSPGRGELLQGRGTIFLISVETSVPQPWLRRRTGNGNVGSCDPQSQRRKEPPSQNVPRQFQPTRRASVCQQPISNGYINILEAETVFGLEAASGLVSGNDYLLCPPSTGNPTHVGPGATECWQLLLKDQHEGARARVLLLGMLYTSAIVAFVLYKCFRCKDDEAPVLQEETGRKQPLQLEQQLIQTEQHLDNLMAQLDPLFECVTTLAGAQ
uniref:Coiled-coil domain containing 107 n=1 Tax=Theropithecus gelada TaxID=9565 RepID=A0A8D2FD62_THEGE